MISGQLGKITGVKVDGVEFVPQIVSFLGRLDQLHWPTVIHRGAARGSGRHRGRRHPGVPRPAHQRVRPGRRLHRRHERRPTAIHADHRAAVCAGGTGRVRPRRRVPRTGLPVGHARAARCCPVPPNAAGPPARPPAGAPTPHHRHPVWGGDGPERPGTPRARARRGVPRLYRPSCPRPACRCEPGCSAHAAARGCSGIA
jgi:hypothetical protein